ncbi:MAG: repeat-containing protein [Phycisphaerales bacterium]|nr:repeat-containing protein [Phycisphaerales bacterium]
MPDPSATPPPDRLVKLLAMLDRTPGDPFTLYAVALEHKKSGRPAEAIEFLDRTIQFDPGYCYAYFQKGQVLEDQGDVEGAKAAYRAGIAAARAKGDAHALSELEGQLQMIE